MTHTTKSCNSSFQSTGMLGSYIDQQRHISKNRPHLVSICQTQTHPDIVQPSSEDQDAPL